MPKRGCALEGLLIPIRELGSNPSTTPTTPTTVLSLSLLCRFILLEPNRSHIVTHCYTLLLSLRTLQELYLFPKPNASCKSCFSACAELVIHDVYPPLSLAKLLNTYDASLPQDVSLHYTGSLEPASPAPLSRC